VRLRGAGGDAILRFRGREGSFGKGTRVATMCEEKAGEAGRLRQKWVSAVVLS